MGPRLADDDAPPTSLAWHDRPLDDQGVMREPTADGRGAALWFPKERDSGFQHWERLGSVPHSEFTVEPGIQALAATSIRVSQPLQGRWGKLWRRFRRQNEGRTWVLPNGETCEQCGERRSDLLLVWSEDEAVSLDAAWLQSRWPASRGARRLGANVFVVVGVEPPDPGSAAAQAQAGTCPNQAAERLLAVARQASDRRKEITALIDLGLALVHQGNGARALVSLDQALGLARQCGDPVVEVEVLGHIGLALLWAGQAHRALPLLEQRLVQARGAGDRFAEKTVLEHRGLAYAQLRNPTNALASFEQALALARAVRHRKHEADLLWYVAIQHAELGRREEAIAQAQAAIDLMQQLGNPQAAWYADHLRKYRSGETADGFAASEPTGTAALWNGSITAGLWSAPSAVPQTASGPGWLRMALSVAKSMARFVGSGFKMVAPQTLQRRLRTCAACVHHTGLRCQLCGCFTHAKARMAHEECPIGKWSS